VEFARRGYATLNETLKSGVVDLSAIEETWTPDCVLRPSGLLPESAEMHGHEGIAQFVTAQMEAFEEMEVEAVEFLDAGDRIVVPIRFGGKARHTAIEVNFAVVHVMTVPEGNVARLDMFRDKAEALEAEGLRE
jgi:ketosteroid isomerase-like protein